MGVNTVLRDRMAQLGLTQEQLAERLNDALREITGRPGDTSARAVRNLLNGSSRRPIGRTCAALERVFGCSVEDLGLTAPRSMPRAPRRSFMISTARTAVAATSVVVPVARQRRAVGMTDVARATAGMDALVEADDRQGGNARLAEQALEGRARVLELQTRNASDRVRRSLYAVAAEYTTIAAWSCIDGRNLDRAQTYLHESTTFAGLSQDPATTMRVWVNLAMLAYQRKDWPGQLAAAQVASACPAARRDPFFRSLGRVRVGLAHAALGDPRAARRALGAAQDSLHKAADEARPRWTAFYGTAELNHLAAIIFNLNEASHDAEAMAHRALARMPDDFQRNRALATCQLALAQLRQGEPEQATATATAVFATMNGAPLPGRMRTLIGDFHRELFRLAPSTAYARDWADRMRDEWSRG